MTIILPGDCRAMGTVRKTITLTSKQDAWIKAQIERGDFTNDSEYIRDLVRRDQERALRFEALERRIAEGLDSGVSGRTLADIWAEAERSEPAGLLSTMSEAPDTSLDLDGIVTMLRAALPTLELLYLFGSRARGVGQPGSDVDLAVHAGGRIPREECFRLQEQLARHLHRDVDLIDLSSATTVMRIQVIEHGNVLYEREANMRARFEMTSMSAYARLNEERRGILEDVRKRGTVYG